VISLNIPWKLRGLDVTPRFIGVRILTGSWQQINSAVELANVPREPAITE
jgi:hypothetical protein